MLLWVAPVHFPFCCNSAASLPVSPLSPLLQDDKLLTQTTSQNSISSPHSAPYYGWMEIAKFRISSSLAFTLAMSRPQIICMLLLLSSRKTLTLKSLPTCFLQQYCHNHWRWHITLFQMKNLCQIADAPSQMTLNSNHVSQRNNLPKLRKNNWIPLRMSTTPLHIPIVLNAL